MKTKRLVITAIALGIITLTGAYGVVQAQDTGEYPVIIQRLVERFSLDPAEVQEVFAEVRAENRESNHARFEERFDKAVEDGVITEEQKQAILEKKSEMRDQYMALKDLSPEEMREVKKEHYEEMKVWAEVNGIDLKMLMGRKGFHKGYHGFGHFGFGYK